MEKLYLLTQEMVAYYEGQPKWIQHFIKVHSFAKLIGEGENMSQKDLFILEASAIVHDIGIKICDEKFGHHEGKLQEVEGPPLSAEMMAGLGFEQQVIERVSFLVAHHHTYSNITDLDHQILVEADFLVNLHEKDEPLTAVQSVYEKIFRTKTGKDLCRTMFGLS